MTAGLAELAVLRWAVSECGHRFLRLDKWLRGVGSMLLTNKGDLLAEKLLAVFYSAW